jgi:hypothetical protein
MARRGWKGMTAYSPAAGHPYPGHGPNRCIIRPASAMPAGALVRDDRVGQAGRLPVAVRPADRSAPARIAVIATPRAANPRNSASETQLTMPGPT